MKRIVIAVDGPAGSGKSSVSKEVAVKAGIKYVDSGAIYRSITLYMIEKFGTLDSSADYGTIAGREMKISQTFSADGTSLTEVNGRDVSLLIRDEKITKNIGIISDNRSVRDFVTGLLRSWAAEESIIMDGRDIGTVVFPNADLKIYCDASVEIRALRRQAEYAERGKNVDVNEIKQQIMLRDEQDRSRAYGALKIADSAIILDTSNMTKAQVIDTFLDKIRLKQGELSPDHSISTGFTRMSDKMTEQFDDSMTMESLLESSPEIETGQLFKGEVVSTDEKNVYVNIGRKNEGFVPVHEFETLPKAGDTIDVVMRSGKLHDGMHQLSHRAAKAQSQWTSFVEKGLKEGAVVTGSVKKFTGKGAIISLDDITAFLPLSHAGDIRLKESEGKSDTFSFKIIGIDPEKHSIIVSRIEIVAEEKDAAWQRIVSSCNEGDKIRGKVSRFVDFGAFVDLGGFEALLHNNDLTWRKVYKKKKIIQLGEEREFIVLSIKKDEKKISLGLKQLSVDPWSEMSKRYPEGTRIEGVVTTIANFGVFVEIEDGIEGLVIPSECGWAKRPVNPKDVVKKGDRIAVVVTGVDTENRKLSLSIRLAQENPWDSLERKYPAGTVLKKPVKRIVSFGIFVEIENDIDGLVHISDVSWDDGEKNLSEMFKPGQEVEFKILGIDKQEMRISCGIKQLTRSPWEAIREKYPPRSRVNGTITNITSFGLFVKLEDNVEGLVHISEASRRKVEDLNEIYKVGETVNVVVLNVDTDKKKMSLSIKHHDIMSEKEELKKIMTSSSSSTATIGDLLKLKQDGNK